jgi:hypothetical protein
MGPSEAVPGRDGIPIGPIVGNVPRDGTWLPETSEVSPGFVAMKGRVLAAVRQIGDRGRYRGEL